MPRTFPGWACCFKHNMRACRFKHNMPSLGMFWACSGLGMLFWAGHVHEMCISHAHLIRALDVLAALVEATRCSEPAPTPARMPGRAQRVRKRQQRQAQRRLLTHLHSNLTRRTTTWGSPLCFGQMSLMVTATR